VSRANADTEDDEMVDLCKLRKKVKASRCGSAKLDAEFAAAFPGCPPDVSRSTDAAMRFIDDEIRGFEWRYAEFESTTSGDRKLRKYGEACAGPTGPRADALLSHPKVGWVFWMGFNGWLARRTVPLALLNVFLQAKIVLALMENFDDPSWPRKSCDEVLSARTRARMRAAGWLQLSVLGPIKEAGLNEREINLLLDGVG
jgi:hypothetical protein